MKRLGQHWLPHLQLDPTASSKLDQKLHFSRKCVFRTILRDTAGGLVKRKERKVQIKKAKL